MNPKLKTILIQILLWIVLICLPFYFTSKTLIDFHPAKDYHALIHFGISNILLIIVFYVNYFFLIPKLLFQKKYILYFLICIFLFFFLFESPRWITELFMPQRPIMRPDENAMKMFPMLFSNSILMFISVFVSSIALRINKRLQQIESFKYNTQLNNLRAQINPHFLFNTLNSIYSVTIKKAPEAADMVEKLAEMMRFTLKESQSDFVSLQNEITYIQNYIELQKIRLDNNVKINFQVHGDLKPYRIAPLLLIPFVENAFKYGVNSEENSLIDIHIKLLKNILNVSIKNNIVNLDHSLIEKNGVGIENTLKRLDLIYPHQHQCAITETENVFTVNLTITLS
jgi:hypothetical protein